MIEHDRTMIVKRMGKVNRNKLAIDRNSTMFNGLLLVNNGNG